MDGWIDVGWKLCNYIPKRCQCTNLNLHTLLFVCWRLCLSVYAIDSHSCNYSTTMYCNLISLRRRAEYNRRKRSDSSCSSSCGWCCYCCCRYDGFELGIIRVQCNNKVREKYRGTTDRMGKTVPLIVNIIILVLCYFLLLLPPLYFAYATASSLVVYAIPATIVRFTSDLPPLRAQKSALFAIRYDFKYMHILLFCGIRTFCNTRWRRRRFLGLSLHSHTSSYGSLRSIPCILH